MAESSGKATKRRGPGKPFAKGQSGNPGGRKAVPQEVKEMLKAATTDAAKLLINTISDDQAKLDIRIRCAEVVLDRVYGKAAQPIDGVLTTARVEIGEDDAQKALEALGYVRK